MASQFRKHLSITGLLKIVHKFFITVSDPRALRKNTVPLIDHLMSGLAVFGLKCPSLLAYERGRFETATAQNLHNLYYIGTPPSDTYLRERLDEVSPDALRPVFKKIFAEFQRGKGLEGFEFLDGHILMSGDGTGQFASNKICCPQCCKKNHKNGTTSYYHQMFGVCIVHPDKSNVIPLCPEPILNQDGSEKNDCERNACKRFLENFRREHPHLKVILLEDGLSSTAPNISMIERCNMKYILVAKPGDHQFLFKQLEANDEVIYHDVTTEDGRYHQFRSLNGISLNKSNQDVQVNFIEYRMTDLKGKELNFSWVTNIPISKSNALKIAIGGRARWKVENETFNTLKNLGYNFAHNYGHGKQYLSTIFCMLMMLAFLIDQIQAICCTLFQGCKKRLGTYRDLWNSMRSLFRLITFYSWENFYQTMSNKQPYQDTSYGGARILFYTIN